MALTASDDERTVAEVATECRLSCPMCRTSEMNNSEWPYMAYTHNSKCQIYTCKCRTAAGGYRLVQSSVYFATVKEGCTPNRHDSTEALVQYSLAQVQLTTQRYHTRVELYSNIPTGHSTAIPTWYCG